jgi:hypothetical protein
MVKIRNIQKRRFTTFLNSYLDYEGLRQNQISMEGGILWLGFSDKVNHTG